MAENAKKQGLFSGHANSAAFVVESLLLLAALIAAMAVFTQLFAGSLTQANESKREVNAIAVAQNTAERFCAHPESAGANDGDAGTGSISYAAEGSGSAGTMSMTSSVTQDGEEFTVTCDVSTSVREAGIMYQAHITVSDDAGVAYELDSTRYASEVG